MENRDYKFTFWLPEGKTATVKASSYELLLDEIDRFFDKFKEATTYYLGYDDETVIQEAIDDDINLEIEK